MGSLLDGIDVPSAGANKSPKPVSGTPDSSKNIKLAIVAVGLLVGGGLIAWNLGLFGDGSGAAINSPAASAQSGTGSGSEPVKRVAGSITAPAPANGAPPPVLKSGPQSFTR